MVLNGDNIKRLIIYFVYDRDGIVDDYILYMLRDLKRNSSEIAVVCNGKMEESSLEKVREITPVVIVRENKGLDVWAYKTVLDHYGWQQLSEYDEVIMMNFTIMGPVYPLREMFEKMNQRDLDFWGITKYHKYEEGDPFGTISYGYIPEHIQSHFIAVRKNMLNSAEFQTYWDNMQPIHDYREAVGCHEAIFTKKFSEAGFTWDVYADMGDGYNNHPILCATKAMLIEKRCPVFKRRSFMQHYENIINDTNGQEAMETYEYLDKHTDYDVNMIWDNILRLENQADIKKNLQLNYTLDSKRGSDISQIIKEKKIALVLHFYFEDLAEYCLHYVQSMPAEADIYVTVGSEKKKAIIEETFKVLPNKVQTILIENRGRDVSALLVGTKDFIMDYDYVCFVHDKKVTQLTPQTIGAGFSYKCFENLLASKEFVENVITTFEENPRLGLLTPPPPIHGDYYITLGLEWGLNYDVTKELAEKLQLTVPISPDKEPVAPLGTMFWFRPKSMKRLFEQDWKYEDFPKEPNNIDGTLLHAVERIYSYVVQQEGFYPAWIFNEAGANIEITNLYYMLREMNRVVFFEGSGAGRYTDVLRNMREAFKEWRWNCNTLINNPGVVANANVYLPGKDGYTEKSMVSSDNKPGEAAYKYTNLAKFGPVKEFRWDPGEKGNIMIRDLKVKVYLQDGNNIELSLKDATTNGFMVKGNMVFLSPDPQLYFRLPEKAVVDTILIETDLSNYVTAETTQYIQRKLQKGYWLQKLKRKIFH